jgi:hypothetical protein
MKKINPEKMQKVVRLLYEISILKNLSPEKLAPFLNVSHMQIYRWFAGQKPKPGSEQLILLGIEKINQAIPGDKNGLVAWGRRWNKESPKKDEKYYAEVDRFFKELESCVPKKQLDFLKIDDDAYLIFQNIIALAKDYKIRLPRI